MQTAPQRCTCHARTLDTITWLHMSPGVGLWVGQMNPTLLLLGHVLYLQGPVSRV